MLHHRMVLVLVLVLVLAAGAGAGAGAGAAQLLPAPGLPHAALWRALPAAAAPLDCALALLLLSATLPPLPNPQLHQLSSVAGEQHRPTLAAATCCGCLGCCPAQPCWPY
jgi:hypothetical protein